jgi:hypothetical protein
MKKQKLILFIAVLCISLFLLGYLIFVQIKNSDGRVYCSPGQKETNFCTEEYSPVCGWFDKTIQCFKYPCAQTFSNVCFACMDSKVEYYTQGQCPK